MAKTREAIMDETETQLSQSENKNGAANGNGKYSEQDIQILEGLEAVRVRPGMYIGATDQRGLHHLIYEVVDNSIDEVMDGYADTISVIISAEGAVMIENNGRGLPVVVKRQPPGLSTLEVVVTT